MIYRQLGNTDTEVSLICLGTMTFGQQNTEKEGHAQLDYALDQGVNFIDTAELYSVPPMAETYGSTEKIIGTWDKLKTHRDKIILATKAMGPMSSGGYAREGQGGPRFTAASLREGLEKSLRRLQVDYIDLYQLHWPERHTNCFGQRGYKHKPTGEEVSLEETLTALKGFPKRRGKSGISAYPTKPPGGSWKVCASTGKRDFLG
jgi:aryl-alcohol dehydrogenase-like predicted oxidoreductase